MIEFVNPHPEYDMHAGTVVRWDTDNPNIFAIRTWRAFSSKTLEFEGSESHWLVDRTTSRTYLILYKRRYRFTQWHSFNVDEFNRHDPRHLLPEDHIREARWYAKDTLGISGPYRRLELVGMYGNVPQPSA